MRLCHHATFTPLAESVKYLTRNTALIFRCIFWFCEKAAHCYRPPVSEAIDLTIFEDQLAEIIFTHSVQSETVIKNADEKYRLF